MSSKLNISYPERALEEKFVKVLTEVEDVFCKYDLNLLEVLNISRFLLDSSIMDIITTDIKQGEENEKF